MRVTDPDLLAFRIASGSARVIPAKLQPEIVGEVYFVEAIGLERVKIGWTSDLTSRLDALQSACPVELLVRTSIRGIQKKEFQFHRRFADYRVWPRREWFRLTGTLATFLRRHDQKRAVSTRLVAPGSDTRKDELK